MAPIMGDNAAFFCRKSRRRFGRKPFTLAARKTGVVRSRASCERSANGIPERRPDDQRMGGLVAYQAQSPSSMNSAPRRSRRISDRRCQRHLILSRTNRNCGCGWYIGARRTDGDTGGSSPTMASCPTMGVVSMIGAVADGVGDHNAAQFLDPDGPLPRPYWRLSPDRRMAMTGRVWARMAAMSGIPGVMVDGQPRFAALRSPVQSPSRRSWLAP